MKIRVKVEWINSNVDDDNEDDEKGADHKDDVHFKVDDDVPLGWLMISYCDKVRADFGTTYFEFKGGRLRVSDTPRTIRMLSDDVIYASPSQCSNGLGQSNRRVDNGNGSIALYQATICIRMHKESETLLRVVRAEPLLPQLIRGLANVGPHEGGSVCFVHDGVRLTEHHTAEELNIVNGDVIDAFNFDQHSSSLSIIGPLQDSPKSQHILGLQDSLKSLHTLGLQDSQPRLITVKVVRESCEMMCFRMKGSTRLSRMMDIYCKRESLHDGAAFIYKWRRLVGSKTVDEEQVEDGGVIHVLPH